MVKIVEPVVLNSLQFHTLHDMEEKADSKRVVHEDVIATYKQNVVKALIRRGVLVLFRGKHYKIANVPIELKPEIVSRKPKPVAEPVIDNSNDAPMQ